VKTQNKYFYLLIILTTLFFSTSLHPQYKIDDYWLTKFEKSGYLETARYEESIHYFKKFEDVSEYVKMFSIGKSPQGRDIYCLVVSKEKAFTPESARKTGKPLLMIENGIHAGEIEGKDASMILLREILVTKEKADYLNYCNLIIIPILSVDGHERVSKYNRINQNGPTEMGWRTTAQNFNLNRDWLKADAPETQYILKLFSDWLPDFFIDNHTTNGADFQYTLTYGIEKFKNVYPGMAEVITKEFIPYLEKHVEEKGFLIFPYLGFRNNAPEKGLYDWFGSPRLSNGYVAIQNRLCLLVETHMMKPYKERVFATKAAIEAVIEYLGKNSKEILALNKEADLGTIEMYAKEKKFFPIQFKLTDSHSEIVYKGFKSITDSSEISGGIRTTFTNEKYETKVPFYNSVEPIDSVSVPYAYVIPQEWEWVVERLKLHGVEVEKLTNNMNIKVTKYKFKDVKFSEVPYEGRQTVNYNYEVFTAEEIVPEGSFIVKTEQRALRVILWLLEPKSGDSFLRWGFFNTIFEKKEYFEPYVMEKIAVEMLNEIPGLKEEFELKLAEDKIFRGNPYQRLNFFYERSPYFDQKLNFYPVLRVENSF